MAKYEIIINEINEDGGKTPFYPNPKDDDPKTVEGFCLMARYGETKKGFESTVCIHDVSSMHMALMIMNNPYLREATELSSFLRVMKAEKAEEEESSNE